MTFERIYGRRPFGYSRSTPVPKPEDFPPTKMCSRCMKWKPREDFYVAITQRTGRSNACKQCVKRHAKESAARKRLRESAGEEP